jgi:hypothetical protein
VWRAELRAERWDEISLSKKLNKEVEVNRNGAVPASMQPEQLVSPYMSKDRPLIRVQKKLDRYWMYVAKEVRFSHKGHPSHLLMMSDLDAL